MEIISKKSGKSGQVIETKEVDGKSVYIVKFEGCRNNVAVLAANCEVVDDEKYEVEKTENGQPEAVENDSPSDHLPAAKIPAVIAFNHQFRLFKIKGDDGKFHKLNVVGFKDIRTRFILAMDLFSESDAESSAAFTKLLAEIQFSTQRIRLRPDNAMAFKNLKKPVADMNHSIHGFFLELDTPRPLSAKDKVHFEISCREMNNFEAKIIRKFSDRITERVPATIFISDRKADRSIANIDIAIDELRQTGLIEEYINRCRDKRGHRHQRDL